MKQMKKYKFLLLSILLSVVMFCACEKSDAPLKENDCLMGIIDKYITPDSVYIYITDLGDWKQSYIRAIVVHKDEIPMSKYEVGDMISFKIAKIISEYPTCTGDVNLTVLPDCFVCSIKKCE